MDYAEIKDEVLNLYYGTDLTTLDISIKLQVPRETVLQMIQEDYGE